MVRILSQFLNSIIRTKVDLSSGHFSPDHCLLAANLTEIVPILVCYFDPGLDKFAEAAILLIREPGILPGNSVRASFSRMDEVGQQFHPEIKISHHQGDVVFDFINRTAVHLFQVFQFNGLLVNLVNEPFRGPANIPLVSVIMHMPGFDGSGLQFPKGEIVFNTGLNGSVAQQVDHRVVGHLIHISIFEYIEIVAEFNDELLFVNIIGF